MKKFQLEKSTEPGVAIRVQDFDGDPPTLAPEKGLVWVPYVVPVPPAPTPEQIAADLESALDRFIHKAAWERRFDSLNSARSLAGFENSRRVIATAIAAWAEDCYDVALSIQAEVAAQTRPIPTKEEMLAEMPEVPAQTGPVVRTWVGPI